ncbi:putative lysine decarboxylase [compost metagenome]
MNTSITSRVGQQIQRELQLAKDQLEAIGRGVSIFGGARVQPRDLAFRNTVELAQAISLAGMPVISGGGPGIMLAANIGAKEGGSASIGLNILLPHEQKPNDFQDISVEFAHFASRKTAFCKYSAAFVVMSGGLGTLDELFEVLTLIQTGKMPRVPVILYGSSFWAGLLDWMRQQMLAQGCISEADFDLVQVVDTVEEAMAVLAPVIEAHAVPAEAV